MRAEAEAALDRDRVTERYMEAMTRPRMACVGVCRKLLSPPPFLATCETRGSQVEEAVTGRT